MGIALLCNINACLGVCNAISLINSICSNTFHHHFNDKLDWINPNSFTFPECCTIIDSALIEWHNTFSFRFVVHFHTIMQSHRNVPPTQAANGVRLCSIDSPAIHTTFRQPPNRSPPDISPEQWRAAPFVPANAIHGVPTRRIVANDNDNDDDTDGKNTHSPTMTTSSRAALVSDNWMWELVSCAHHHHHHHPASGTQLKLTHSYSYIVAASITEKKTAAAWT